MKGNGIEMYESDEWLDNIEKKRKSRDTLAVSNPRALSMQRSHFSEVKIRPHGDSQWNVT
jgi:hypothetical protein